jgi:hypothetical protein
MFWRLLGKNLNAIWSDADSLKRLIKKIGSEVNVDKDT